MPHEERLPALEARPPLGDTERSQKRRMAPVYRKVVAGQKVIEALMSGGVRRYSPPGGVRLWFGRLVVTARLVLARWMRPY